MQDRLIVHLWQTKVIVRTRELISENWTKDEQLRILFESWGPGGEIQRDNQNKNPCIFVLFESCPYMSSRFACVPPPISGEHTSLCINALFAEKEFIVKNLILIKCGRFGLPLFCFGNFWQWMFQNICASGMHQDKVFYTFYFVKSDPGMLVTWGESLSGELPRQVSRTYF